MAKRRITLIRDLPVGKSEAEMRADKIKAAPLSHVIDNVIKAPVRANSPAFRSARDFRSVNRHERVSHMAPDGTVTTDPNPEATRAMGIDMGAEPSCSAISVIDQNGEQHTFYLSDEDIRQLVIRGSISLSRLLANGNTAQLNLTADDLGLSNGENFNVTPFNITLK